MLNGSEGLRTLPMSYRRCGVARLAPTAKGAVSSSFPERWLCYPVGNRKPVPLVGLRRARGRIPRGAL